MKASLQSSQRVVASLAGAGLLVEQCRHSPRLACEPPYRAAAAAAAATPPIPSWWRRNVSWIYPLPIPRTLVKKDSIFAMGNIQSQRQDDARRIHALQPRIQKARGDMQALNEVAYQITSIMYGKGLTPQDRENFLAQYGCTGWTVEVLETLLDLAKDRGIVEIGAGHGQWARALNDLYKESTGSDFEVVTAFDTMQELPLNANVYRRTQPAHDYFYSKVQQCTNPFQVMEQPATKGRVLMLVFPSPGSDMALDSLKAYIATGDNHDTLVYVGEGRGGANAPDEFFDYLEDNQWILVKVMAVKSFGTKGQEKLYILKRPPVQEPCGVFSTLHKK